MPILTGCRAFLGLIDMDGRMKETIRGHMRWLSANGAEGERADFSGMDLTGIDLRCADLSVAIFKGCDLSNVNMSGGFFTMADFSGAKMTGIRMNDADLRGASFRKANVQKGNFANANLGYLNVETERGGRRITRIPTAMHEADMTGSIFIGADLEGATPRRMVDAQVRRRGLYKCAHADRERAEEIV